jgi:cobalt/nickel transport system permease protein
MADTDSPQLERQGTVCHRLPPRVKVLLTFAVILLGVSVPPKYWPVQGMLATFVFVGHSFARIPLSYLLRRLAVFLPMLLMVSFSFPLSQGFETGWAMMSAILFRGTLTFLAVLWLVNVMPFDQLLVTLRKFHVPAIFVATLSFMYRYLFLLWDELETMRMARRARSFGRQSLFSSWRHSIQLIGMLLIRAMQRAERVHGAMSARGWDGHVRTLDSADSTVVNHDRNVEPE